MPAEASVPAHWRLPGRIVLAYLLPILVMTLLPLWWYRTWSEHEVGVVQMLLPPQMIAGLPVYAHGPAHLDPRGSQPVTWTVRMPDPMPAHLQLELRYAMAATIFGDTQWIPAVFRDGAWRAELPPPAVTTAALHLELRTTGSRSATISWLLAPRSATEP